jgi:hypothetical protein
MVYRDSVQKVKWLKVSREFLWLRLRGSSGTQKKGNVHRWEPYQRNGKSTADWERDVVNCRIRKIAIAKVNIDPNTVYCCHSYTWQSPDNTVTAIPFPTASLAPPQAPNPLGFCTGIAFYSLCSLHSSHETNTIAILESGITSDILNVFAFFFLGPFRSKWNSWCKKISSPFSPSSNCTTLHQLCFKSH